MIEICLIGLFPFRKSWRTDQIFGLLFSLFISSPFKTVAFYHLCLRKPR